MTLTQAARCARDIKMTKLFSLEQCEMPFSLCANIFVLIFFFPVLDLQEIIRRLVLM